MPIQPATPKPSEEGYILIWVIFLLAVFTLALPSPHPSSPSKSSSTANGKRCSAASNTFAPSSSTTESSTPFRPTGRAGQDQRDPLSAQEVHRPHHRQRRLEADPLRPEQGSNGNGILWAAHGRVRLNDCRHRAQRRKRNQRSFSRWRTRGQHSAPVRCSRSSSSGTAPGAAGSAAGTPGTAGSSSSDTGLSGQTFGGAGIIGFEPAAARQSIMIYKKKNKYNEWEFVYDPLNDHEDAGGQYGKYRSARQQHHQSSRQPRLQLAQQRRSRRRRFGRWWPWLQHPAGPGICARDNPSKSAGAVT